MQRNVTKRPAKYTVNTVNGWEVTPSAFYPISSVNRKTGISLKQLRQLINDKKVIAKRIGRSQTIAGYSFIDWLNQPD